MTAERKINSRLDLTKEEAVIEYIELREYLKSENWVHSVIERVERRMKALAEIVMNLAIEDKRNGRTIQ